MKLLRMFFPKKVLGKSVLQNDMFMDRRGNIYIVNKVEGDTIHFTKHVDGVYGQIDEKEGNMSFEEFRLTMINRR